MSNDNFLKVITVHTYSAYLHIVRNKKKWKSHLGYLQTCDNRKIWCLSSLRDFHAFLYPLLHASESSLQGNRWLPLARWYAYFQPAHSCEQLLLQHYYHKATTINFAQLLWTCFKSFNAWSFYLMMSAFLNQKSERYFITQWLI